MREIKDGGPAFPQCSYNMKGGYDITGGMTLRDYFAAKAMPCVWNLIYRQIDQGVLPEQHADAPHAYAATMSYEQADAMIAERAK